MIDPKAPGDRLIEAVEKIGAYIGCGIFMAGLFVFLGLAAIAKAL